ncbi:hypothetical protein CEXT_626991, partial [Caerostris extrusa]
MPNWRVHSCKEVSDEGDRMQEKRKCIKSDSGGETFISPQFASLTATRQWFLSLR